MFTQLNPPIPLFHVERGNGHAIGVIDYSQEHSLLWVFASDNGGEIWVVSNEKVRMRANITMNRAPDVSEIVENIAYKTTDKNHPHYSTEK